MQDRGLARDLLDLRVERAVGFLIDELVDQEAGHQRPVHAVEGAPGLLPRFHLLAVRVPEVGRQLAHAGVEQVGVLQHLVVEVVLGRQRQRTRLDAHVDVLGHQDHLAARVGFLQMADHGEDLVVGLAAGQRRGQLAVDRLGLQEQAAGRLLVALRRQRDAIVDVGLAVVEQTIEEAADLTRVARDLRHALLVVVQLLERGHGQEDVVLLEAEQTGRVVHQHVGVQHEQLGVGVQLGDLGGFAHQGQGSGVEGSGKARWRAIKVS